MNKPVVTIGRYQDRIPSDRPIEELIATHGKGNVYIDGVTVAAHEEAEQAVTALEKAVQAQSDDAAKIAISKARTAVAEMVDAAARRVKNNESHPEDEAVFLASQIADENPDFIEALSDEVNQPNLLVAIQARVIEIAQKGGE